MSKQIGGADSISHRNHQREKGVLQQVLLTQVYETVRQTVHPFTDTLQLFVLQLDATSIGAFEFVHTSCPSAYRTRIRISCLDGGPRPAFGLLTLRIVPGLVCRLTVWDRPQPLRPLLLSCYGPVRVPASFLQLRTSTGTR
ncbi:hypothetical protein GGI42DRAFT_182680 [Trichoderma sp. SZMC 28013]